VRRFPCHGRRYSADRLDNPRGFPNSPDRLRPRSRPSVATELQRRGYYAVHGDRMGCHPGTVRGSGRVGVAGLDPVAEPVGPGPPIDLKVSKAAKYSSNRATQCVLDRAPVTVPEWHRSAGHHLGDGRRMGSDQRVTAAPRRAATHAPKPVPSAEAPAVRGSCPWSCPPPNVAEEVEPFGCVVQFVVPPWWKTCEQRRAPLA
jgi:hypothetical protein